MYTAGTDVRDHGPCGELGRHGKTEAGRVLPNSEYEKIEQENGDIVEHERGNNLVHTQLEFQYDGDERPHGTEYECHDEHERQQDYPRHVRKRQGHPGGTDGAQGKLTLRADVPYLHAEGHGHTQRTEKKRNGFEQCALKSPVVSEAPLPKHDQAMQRVLTLPGRSRLLTNREKSRAPRKTTRAPHFQGSSLLRIFSTYTR